MTTPDSVGKDERGCVRHECKRVRMEMQAEITRLQALDRQRQEEVSELAADRDSWRDQASDRLKEWDAMRIRAEAAEAALAEARGLLHETGRYLDPRHYAAQIAKLTAFLTRTAKEPSNA